MARSVFLLIAALLAAALPPAVAAQSLRGRIVDGSTRQPVGGATVRLLDPDSQQVAGTIADDGGLFTLPAPGAGEYHVSVERIGYTTTVAGPVRLRVNGFANVTVTMRPQPVPVGAVGVQVEAEDAWLRRSGFYDRRQEGMGKYLDFEEIQQRAAGGRMADVLGGISGVRVIADNGTTDVQIRSSMTNVFRPGGPQLCLPLVFVDGLVMADAKMPGPGRMNLEQIRPQDVAGIEIYGEAGTPLQYARGGGQCGAVLFWTRSGPSPR
jgi:hypothetical protein